MSLSRPQFTVRRAMIAVAIVALLLSVPEMLHHWQMKHMAENAGEWARYYEEMGAKTSNPSDRQVYTEWKAAMEYYSRHPAEHPYFSSWNPFRPRTARAEFVGPNGAPGLPRAK